MPAITVLVPVYNGEAYLNLCVQSIIAHKNLDVNVIIHDDCSSDNTQLIAQYLAYRYTNVTYVRADLNSGADHAIGGYMRSCRTTYFSWIGVDDFYAEGGLVAFIEALENSDADFAYSDFQTFGDLSLAPKGYGQFAKVDKLGYFKHFLKTQLNAIPWNGVWKTEHLQSVSNPWRVYSNCGNHSDVICGLAMKAQGVKTLHIPNKLIHYNLRASSGTHNLSNRYYTLPHKMKAFYELLSLQDLLEVHDCEIGDLLACAEAHWNITVRKYIYRLSFSGLQAKEYWQLKSFMLGLSSTDVLAELKERIDTYV